MKNEKVKKIKKREKVKHIIPSFLCFPVSFFLLLLFLFFLFYVFYFFLEKKFPQNP